MLENQIRLVEPVTFVDDDGHGSQRKKLSHRRLATSTAAAELTAPTAVGSGDLGHVIASLS